MQITALTGDELSSLRSRLAHRFPQTATLRAPGDRGIGTVEIPIVLGLPTGACRMPTGAVVSTAWNEYVAAAILKRPDPTGWREDFVADVVLHPDPQGLEELLTRWPALGSTIASLAIKKCGPDAVSIPLPTDRPPEPLAAMIGERQRASWRWVRPTRAAAFAILVEPPPPALWSMFTDAVRGGEANHWRLVRDFLDGCAPQLFKADGAPATLDSLLERWPGVAISLVGPIAALGGAAAEGELGE